MARSWQTLQLLLIALLVAVGITLILLFPILPVRSAYELTLGEVASEDVRAPREISYVSQIETQAARQAARAGVEDLYDPPDPRVGRQQVRRARQVMDFAQDVRADTFANAELKQHYLESISVLSLDSNTRALLLTLTESQFEQVEREVVRLIEDAMSGTVREGRVEEVTSRLELKVSTELPEDLIPISVGLARGLVVANSSLNETATEIARAQAEADVPEIRHSFQLGEIVIRAGERVDDLDLEALVALGLTTRRLTWMEIASGAIASLLALVVAAVYIAAFNPPWEGRADYLLMLAILFALFLAASQFMIPGRGITAYLFPAAALGLALTSLVGLDFALLATIMLAGLVGYIANGSLEVTAFTAVSGLLAAGSLRRDARLNNFFLSGIIAAIGGIGVLLAFRLPSDPDSAQLAQLLVVCVLNGLLSAGLALVILFVVGNITGITTSIQLIDLMRPDHPLQRLMQQEALGSYQHTLSVANLVEAAATAIGANSLLVRIGTLYHDIGKASNPGFFVENRTEGNPNPHDGLSPLASARIIRAHVTDGVRLARRYRLPPAVLAFIPQHHGTTPIAFFLSIAREQAAAAGIQLDEHEFYYEGPIPQTREIAILMLADGCESAVRANRPASVEEMEQIVSRIIQQRIDQHQLDASGLTLTDIRIIRDSFVRTLKGMYHPRVRYPGDEEPSRLPTESIVPPPVAQRAALAEPGAGSGAEGEIPAEPSDKPA